MGTARCLFNMEIAGSTPETFKSLIKVIEKAKRCFFTPINFLHEGKKCGRFTQGWLYKAIDSPREYDTEKAALVKQAACCMPKIEFESYVETSVKQGIAGIQGKHGHSVANLRQSKCLPEIFSHYYQ